MNGKRSPGRAAQIGRALTLTVTNLVKLGGLGIALHEAFGPAQPRVVEIALAAFMMAGAQVSEEAILNLVQRMFGTYSHTSEHSPPPSNSYKETPPGGKR